MANAKGINGPNNAKKLLEDEYLALGTFANKVRLKHDYLRRRLHSGELAGIKHRNRWYVKKSELMHFSDPD